MNENKLVSIVLPIYNGEKYMRTSIESIISQTYQCWELIIIDDCSTDNTPNIAKEYAQKDKRIKYFRNEINLKLPKGLNRGFSLAEGDYLTWTSDDNIYLPSAIESMVKKIESENVQFVFARCDVIDETGKIVDVIAAPDDYKRAILGGNFVGACFMYTRNVYLTVGDYNPDKFLVEDYDYWLRIFSQYEVCYINDTLYQYRWHSGALTSTEKKEKINSVCENVLIENASRFGRLSGIEKYYLYSHLNKLRKEKINEYEKNYYINKVKKYSIFYFFQVRVFRKLKSIFN